MYWSKQEEVIFDIILFILAVFQLSSFFMINTGDINLLNDIILVGVNLMLLAAMIPYAKWVWKTASYQKAFFQVLKHELFMLSLSVTCIVLAIITIKMKGKT